MKKIITTSILAALTVTMLLPVAGAVNAVSGQQALFRQGVPYPPNGGGHVMLRQGVPYPPNGGGHVMLRQGVPYPPNGGGH